jgi:MFS transporter, PAT family, beta-lactamase induction signal transducer AmpG
LEHARQGARKSALALGLACLAWLPYWANPGWLGRGGPIMGTFFTLVFVAAALFLLAGREVLGAGAGPWRRAALWIAPLLLAMHGRCAIDRLAALPALPALRSVAELLIYLVPLAGGIVLLALASRDWPALEAEPQPA